MSTDHSHRVGVRDRTIGRDIGPERVDDGPLPLHSTLGPDPTSHEGQVWDAPDVLVLLLSDVVP